MAKKTEKKEASLLTFELHEKETILTEQLSIKPLKIVNPKSQKNTGVCMITSYGGGFVEGDEVRLNVKCKKNTTSIVSSQANTRVYESTGMLCKQSLSMDIESNAFHVFFNDPLVMHKGGNFLQSSDITVHDDSVLLFVDWFSAGRTANGESFDFKNYETTTKIVKNGHPIIWDNFGLNPERMDVYSPGMLGDHISFLNLFLIGNEHSEKVQLLQEALEKSNTSDLSEQLQINTSRINPDAFIGRYSAVDILSLKKIMNDISASLEHPSLLNYNPLIRKY